MKKILVTGGSGFLGSRITTYFGERYCVYAPSGKQMDITQKDQVYHVYKDFKPNLIIHCAAVSDVGMCEKSPERSWAINVDGSCNIAETAAESGAKCLICSSDQVYFKSPYTGPHSENEIVTPGNIYGKEKQKAEQECLQRNPDSVHLRLSWMYDIQSPNEKEHSDFARTLLHKISCGEKISYPVWDIRGITYVWNVINNLEKAFDLPGGIYNFGAGNERTTYDTVYHLFREMNWDMELLEQNTSAFAEDPRNLSMNQEKINAGGIWFVETLEGMLDAFKRKKRGGY